ncbi:hypothetical protein AAVH_37956, partial [Aphelenchoides avenae]
VTAVETPLQFGFEVELDDEPEHNEGLSLPLRAKRTGNRCDFNEVAGTEKPLQFGFEVELDDEPEYAEELAVPQCSKHADDRCGFNDALATDAPMHDATDDPSEDSRISGTNATHTSFESIEQEPSTSATAAAEDSNPVNGDTDDRYWKTKGESPKPIISRAMECFERKSRDKDTEDDNDPSAISACRVNDAKAEEADGATCFHVIYESYVPGLDDGPEHDEELAVPLRSKRDGDRCGFNDDLATDAPMYDVTDDHRENGCTSGVNSTHTLDESVGQETDLSEAAAAADSKL